ncbi:DUF4390 domain-containing protein [Curvibacter sp. HBC61]|uniref:DUF4390 domain-containing protein n=1 Tax=Curvibacter cyanobacteriorum TaxID=3026422 RepID=A0ABT5MXV7_9BURK|nr:DUF4390 domain-containing protein [Curvibacter sp. HBC61]MDD0838840.1 DUF4390 domain-containing protein [Curvibacter sp. HBC61]
MDTVTSTDFSTPCSKNAQIDRFVFLAGWLLALFLLIGLRPAWADAADIEVSQMRVERTEEGLYLSALVRFDLPQLVNDAAVKGIPLYFVAEAELLRERWYWYDRHMTSATRYMRLAYQPLTRRWRLQVAPTPITNSGLGVSLAQSFDELEDALAAVQRISRWKIAEASDVEGDAKHTVNLRFRLDVSQLPRPFQLGLAGRTDWNLATSRNQRLGPETPK